MPDEKRHLVDYDGVGDGFELFRVIYFDGLCVRLFINVYMGAAGIMNIVTIRLESVYWVGFFEWRYCCGKSGYFEILLYIHLDKYLYDLYLLNSLPS